MQLIDPTRKKFKNDREELKEGVHRLLNKVKDDDSEANLKIPDELSLKLRPRHQPLPPEL